MLQRLICECGTSCPYDEEAVKDYYSLYLPYDDSPHGYLLPSIVAKMPWTSDFRIQHNPPRSVTVLDESNGSNTSQAVNAAFLKLITICIDQHLFHVLDGKHSEPFAILGANYPVQVERFASSLFGITACGACLVAYTNTNGGMSVWIPRRAKHLYSFPGLLDVTVAGGVKAGTSPLDTLAAEAEEEASLSSSFVRANVRATGVLTCMSVTGEDWPGEKGLVLPDVLYVHDLELPCVMVPTPHDDEVEGFRSMSVEEVQHALLTKQFKPDAAIVLIDFFVRHGIITADNEKDFVEIIMHLHRKLPFPIKPSQPG